VLRKLHTYNKSIIAVLLSVSAACSLSISTAAKATSQYDDVIHNTSQVSLERGSSTHVATGDYLNIVSNCANWTSDSGAYALACSSFNAKLSSAMIHGTGWFVVERTAKVGFSIGSQSLSIGDKYVVLGVNDATDNNSQFGEMFNNSAIPSAALFLNGSSTTCSAYIALDSQSDPTVSTVPCTSGHSEASQVVARDDFWLWTSRLLYLNSSVAYPEYPTGYEGVYVLGDEDADGDGLSLAKESAQGTSDAIDHQDTDGDGLDDLTESIWNSEREDIFCKTAVTPHVCAYPDPKKKDVYIEVDWMDDGTTEYKPTNTQLGRVTDMFSDHDINLHFDMGEYGGGNELATYASPLLNNATSSEIDYFDYKSGGNGVTSNFSTDRASIWHYMITGNKYTNDVLPSNSSGWASGVGSNIFIAIGRVKDILDTTWEDKGISNTIAHEIGHNLCLTSTRLYNEQPVQCAYAGIDNDGDVPDFYDLTNYESVMNYHYQLRNDNGFGNVNYSDGSNVEDDHDDWAGIQSGLGKFNIPLTPYVEFGARNSQDSNTQMLDPEGRIIID
jgi:hypothetical protein